MGREGEEHADLTFTHERIADLLQLLVLPERQPVYVHCIDGVSVTGMLIMCLRKLQRWPAASFVAEYARFARDGLEVPTPPPPNVLAFVHSFKPELEFARLLPELLPFWLEGALSSPSASGHQPSAPTDKASRSVLPLMHEQREREHRERGSERDRVHHHHHGGGVVDLRDPAAVLLEAGTEARLPGGVVHVSSGLEALAIEGLTDGARARQRNK